MSIPKKWETLITKPPTKNKHKDFEIKRYFYTFAP